MKKVLILILMLFCITQINAQSPQHEVIASSGDFYKNSSYSLSWTLGESVTETFTASGNGLTQGFQQSLYVVTSISELSIEGISVKVYPNPVSDLIKN